MACGGKIMLRKMTLILLAASLLAVFAGCAVNPVTGKRELNVFATSDDIAIGNRYAPEVEKQLGGAIDDQALQSYVNSVGQKVATVVGTPQFAYRYVAVNDKSMNAMALPGGHIFITKGLLAKLSTEAQLAGVLAHETVHVAARHSTQQMSKQVGMDILLSAASRAGAGEGTLTIANLATQLIALKYSRDDEREADMGGLNYMIAAGYSPWGMVETMEILKANAQTGSFEWLSSHPDPGNRVGYLTQAIQERPLPAGLATNAGEYQRHVLDRLR
jgi:predicted Zn-dependent protease